MLELNQRATFGGAQGRRNSGAQQPRRLILALSLLLIALITLLVKDRQFWFGSEQATIESDMPESAVATQTKSATRSTKSASTAAAKKSVHTTAASVEPKPADAPGVAMTRTVLPPLDVEVVAGDKHKKLHPGTNSTHVEIPSPAANADNLAAETNAAEREPLPAAPAPQASVSASYPLLAQHMNVQGSVVLQAVISAEGVVQDLRVLSGPAILSSAAQQAVREWRFKPVLQNGQAVETKAKITVNFSIKVADNSASTTLAESRASDILIVSR
ncbi:MAG: TonB family protein [Candidatus Sulfotelmatobacter sp.]